MAQPQQSIRWLGLCSQLTQHSSPIVFPEKRSKKVKASSRPEQHHDAPQFDKVNKVDEHRIDIPSGGVGVGGGDEKSDLLGYIVYSGKLVLDKRETAYDKSSRDVQPQNSSTQATNKDAVDAKLTSKALVWGSHVLPLDDVVSVSYNNGLRHFTVHSYPFKKHSCGLSCFIKPRRIRKDYRFLAASTEEAIQWVGGFADQHCFVNCLPHPLVSAKKQASSELYPTDTPPELIFRCKNPPKMLVILNPRSGRSRSTKVFHGIVEPIFKLAGFKLEVVKTTSAGHAKNLASTVDISTCPDGIATACTIENYMRRW